MARGVGQEDGTYKSNSTTQDSELSFFINQGCLGEEDRREPEDPGGLLHDGLHQPCLPHHGQVRAGRQGSEGSALCPVVVTRMWVGVGRYRFRRKHVSESEK